MDTISIRKLRSGDQTEHMKALEIVKRSFKKNFNRYSDNVVYNVEDAWSMVMDSYMKAIESSKGIGNDMSYILYKCRYGMLDYIRKASADGLSKSCEDCGNIYSWISKRCYKCQSEKNTVIMKRQPISDTTISVEPVEIDFIAPHLIDDILNRNPFRQTKPELSEIYDKCVREDKNPYDIMLDNGKSPQFSKHYAKVVIDAIRSVSSELMV